mgnify:CR=1 FL=1
MQKHPRENEHTFSRLLDFFFYLLSLTVMLALLLLHFFVLTPGRSLGHAFQFIASLFLILALLAGILALQRRAVRRLGTEAVRYALADLKSEVAQRGAGGGGGEQIKNSIVVLSKIRSEVDAGTPEYDAILKGCVAKIRPVSSASSLASSWATRAARASERSRFERNAPVCSGRSSV